MFAVPADTPVTIPVEGATDTFVLLLLQIPPVVTSLNVIEKPGQTAKVVPVMPGNPFITVIVAVEKQPDGAV